MQTAIVNAARIEAAHMRGMLALLAKEEKDIYKLIVGYQEIALRVHVLCRLVDALANSVECPERICQCDDST